MAGNHEFAADTGAGGDFGGWIQESQGHDAEDGSGGAQLNKKNFQHATKPCESVAMHWAAVWLESHVTFTFSSRKSSENSRVTL